jgi:5'-phosphate synthase pdxT subunit
MARFGILAIQGDVEAHARVLARAGAEPVLVRRKEELEGLSGLVLPGGESTTMSKGIARLSLLEPLRVFAASGRPVLGTCAGAILLAREVENHPVDTLGALDVAATRNAYGTQVDSFAASLEEPALPELRGLRCVFIRAPKLRHPGPDVEVLGRLDGWPVLVRQGNVFAATFHPELTGDPTLHALVVAAARP